MEGKKGESMEINECGYCVRKNLSSHFKLSLLAEENMLEKWDKWGWSLEIRKNMVA